VRIAAARPTIDVAKRTMRSVSFAAPNRLPIRMNSGAATRGKIHRLRHLHGTIEGDSALNMT
jgi:hypothetical protein